MTDEMKAYILKLVEYMRVRLFLGEWRVVTKFDDTMEDHDQAASDIAERYLETVITFNSNFIAEKYGERDAEYILNLIAHELSHCHAAAMFEAARAAVTEREVEYLRRINEQTTQRIANIACLDVPPEVYAIPEVKNDKQS